MVYKRASGRTKKVKKNHSNDSQKEASVKQRREKDEIAKHQNFTITPRQMIKFELEDAKYSEDYEKLRKTRKLRTKRSTEEQKNGTISNVRMEKFITKETFIQPKEIIKFVFSDAVPFKLQNDDKKIKSEKKTKREVNDTDLSTSDSRKIKITHPLSPTLRIKHVSYEELPMKLQKIVESAINDAVLKGKASDGDYLKFYYGDKVIKVPIALSKYISSTKESSSKGLSDHYTLKTVKYPKEEVVTEAPVVKTVYKYENYQPVFKYDEKAESYTNFVTPKDNYILDEQQEQEAPKIPELPPKKSVFYYASKEEALSSPLPLSFGYEKPKIPEQSIFGKYPIYPSVTKPIIRDSIPITEDLNEGKPNVKIPAPTSYVEYNDYKSDKHEDHYEDKNYAFGYHVSDYKSGNNFGHTQTKNNKEIKGEYSILLPDGRIQITKYFADDSGFHADVSYKNIH